MIFLFPEKSSNQLHLKLYWKSSINNYLSTDGILSKSEKKMAWNWNLSGYIWRLNIIEAEICRCKAKSFLWFGNCEYTIGMTNQIMKSIFANDENIYSGHSKLINISGLQCNMINRKYVRNQQLSNTDFDGWIKLSSFINQEGSINNTYDSSIPFSFFHPLPQRPNFA